MGGGKRTRKVESGKSLLCSFPSLQFAFITAALYGNAAVNLAILQIRFCSVLFLIEKQLLICLPASGPLQLR